MLVFRSSFCQLKSQQDVGQSIFKTHLKIAAFAASFNTQRIIFPVVLTMQKTKGRLYFWQLTGLVSPELANQTRLLQKQPSIL